MELQEFEDVINEAEETLEMRLGTTYHYGVCDALEIIDTTKTTFFIKNTEKMPMDKCFTELFKPKWASHYWLGELNEENLNLRKTALRLFERVSIDSEYYLEY